MKYLIRKNGKVKGFNNAEDFSTAKWTKKNIDVDDYYEFDFNDGSELFIKITDYADPYYADSDYEVIEALRMLASDGIIKLNY